MELQDWRKEPRKNYSNEFKLRMVELASQPGACVAQIARENGVNDNVKNYGDHFTVDSIRQMWDAAIKRAGLRHRKSYQSRHTYACWSLTAGANPAFIANQMGHADAQMVFQV
ncbi:integrase [Escherichia coli]|nr:integrase [Escherichia coli]